MPPIPTTLKIQHGFAVFTYSVFDLREIGKCNLWENDRWVDGDGYRQVTSYINLKTIIGFRVGYGGLLIDVKGHSEGKLKEIKHTGSSGPCGYAYVNTSYICIGSYTPEIVDTLCEALAPLMGATADTTDLLDMT